MKRRIALIIVLLLIVASGVWFIVAGRQGLTALFGEGTSAVEQWCGGQLRAIANHYIRPRFEFDTLDYEYPATVTLRQVSLTDQNEQVVTARAMRIVFTERPRVGRPLVVESIELEDPVVRLRQLDDGSLLGFRDFIASSTGAETDDGGSTRPSDIFAIRRISIVNGTITYETPDAPPMVLDVLTFDLTSDPEQDQGWYAVEAVLERDPLFQFSVDSRLNIDAGELAISAATLDVDLEPDQYRLLPPQLQQLLIEHEVRGRLSVGLHGLLPFADPLAGDLQFEVLLTDASIAFGDYILPAHSLEVLARLEGRLLRLEPAMMAGIGGTLQVIGEIDPAHGWSSDCTIDARGLRIEEVFRHHGDEAPQYAGRVDVVGAISTQLSDLGSSLSGEGNVVVREGRLVNIPLIGGLVRAAGGTIGKNGQDRGSSRLELSSDEIRFREIELVSAAVGARGEGEIGFSGLVDFRCNAGPLERIQGMLGKVGEILGGLTDKLVTYHITGTISEPQFAVKPLGIGTK